jgi:hypothetical protein
VAPPALLAMRRQDQQHMHRIRVSGTRVPSWGAEARSFMASSIMWRLGNRQPRLWATSAEILEPISPGPGGIISGNLKLEDPHHPTGWPVRGNSGCRARGSRPHGRDRAPQLVQVRQVMTGDLVDHALDVLAALLAVNAASAQVALV